MCIFCDAPEIALPIANSKIEPIMTGLRPKMSASEPLKGRNAVLERAYAEPTQEKSSLPLRSAVIVGSAVLTAVRSSALRNVETMTAMKVSQKAEPFLKLAASLFASSASASVVTSLGVRVEAGRDSGSEDSMMSWTEHLGRS